jgi:hypothetical protein
VDRYRLLADDQMAEHLANEVIQANTDFDGQERGPMRLAPTQLSGRFRPRDPPFAARTPPKYRNVLAAEPLAELPQRTRLAPAWTTSTEPRPLPLASDASAGHRRISISRIQAL